MAAAIEAQPVSERQARKLIAGQVKKASTSFYWAMRLLPRERREAIFAVYAFCREVDDIADDDGLSPEVRREGLNFWREEIDRLFMGTPEHHITKALVHGTALYELQKRDFIAVIDGMEMDAVSVIKAPHRGVFDIYCDRVACAVGRLCVHIFGEPGEKGHVLADAEGRALQITNILRDVQEDAERGRLYLPLELLHSRNIFTTDPDEVIQHPEYPGAWRTLASEAAGWYHKAEIAMAACDPDAMKAARIMLEVYKANLERMRLLSDTEIADPSVSKRLVGKGEKLMIAVKHGFFR